MKKIILLLALFIFTFSFVSLFSPPKVRAETIDVTQDWEYYIPEGSIYYNIRIWVQTVASTTYMTIDIPASTTLKTTYDGETSYIGFYGLGQDPLLLQLSDYTDFTSAETLTIDYAGHLFDGNNIAGYDFIIVEIETALTTFGTAELQWWYVTFLPNAQILWDTTMFQVEYYVTGVLWDVKYYYSGNPYYQVPTVPSGFTFVGWKTVDGNIFNFNQFVNPDLFVGADSNILKLYAYYVSSSLVDNTAPLPTPTVPLFLTDFMDSLNADNDVGYLLLYFIGIFVMVSLMLIFKASLFPTLIITMPWSVAFILMQVLPVWIIVLMCVLYIALFVKVTTDSQLIEGD